MTDDTEPRIMKACNQYTSLLIEVASGTEAPGQRQRLEEHLADCEACSSEYRRLMNLPATVRPVQADPGEAFWRTYYDGVVNRLEAESRPARRSAPALQLLSQRVAAALRPPRWALQLGVALLLVASGIVIGRAVFAPTAEGPTRADRDVDALRQAALEARAHDYLGRSKTLLLGIVNFDPDQDDPGMLNIERRRAMAGDLIAEASLLRPQLATTDHKRLRELISDLEVILLQIANIESTHELPEIEMVRVGVDRKSILFKIEVEEMRRSDDAEPPQERTNGTST